MSLLADVVWGVGKDGFHDPRFGFTSMKSMKEFRKMVDMTVQQDTHRTNHGCFELFMLLGVLIELFLL